MRLRASYMKTWAGGEENRRATARNGRKHACRRDARQCKTPRTRCVSGCRCQSTTRTGQWNGKWGSWLSVTAAFVFKRQQFLCAPMEQVLEGGLWEALWKFLSFLQMRVTSQNWRNAGKYGTYCEMFFFSMKHKPAKEDAPVGTSFGLFD